MKGLLVQDATFVVVDVETTGMDPETDRITEIAMMKIRDGTLQDEFSTLINPLIPIPEFITRLTGIDDLMVQDAPTARDVAPTIAEFLGDAIFVAHNAPFDWGSSATLCGVSGRSNSRTASFVRSGSAAGFCLSFPASPSTRSPAL